MHAIMRVQMYSKESKLIRRERSCSIHFYHIAAISLSLVQSNAFCLNLALMPKLRKLLEGLDMNVSLMDVSRGTCAVLAEAMNSVARVGNRCDLTWTTHSCSTKGITVSSFPRLKAADNASTERSKQQVETLESCSRFLSARLSWG